MFLSTLFTAPITSFFLLSFRNKNIEKGLFSSSNFVWPRVSFFPSTVSVTDGRVAAVWLDLCPLRDSCRERERSIRRQRCHGGMAVLGIVAWLGHSSALFTFTHTIIYILPNTTQQFVEKEKTTDDQKIGSRKKYIYTSVGFYIAVHGTYVRTTPNGFM